MPKKKADKPEIAIKNRTSGKPGIQHLLKEIFPSEFYPQQPPSDVTNSFIEIEDAIQTLREFREFSGVKKSHDFASALLNRAIDQLKKHPRTAIYIICYDKGYYTPLAKGAEQGKRNEAKEIGEINRENHMTFETQMKVEQMKLEKLQQQEMWSKLEYVINPEDGDLPSDLPELLNRRDGIVQRIIGDIVYIWLSCQKTNHSINVPLGKTLIIDGHHLKREKLEKLGIKIPDSVVDPECVPIMIYRPTSSTQTCEVRMAVELTNQIGEFDFTSFYLYRRMLDAYNKPLNLVIHSTDTDTVILAMFFIALAKHRGSEIWWRRSANKRTFSGSGKNQASSTNENWVHINTLCSKIQDFDIDLSDQYTTFYKAAVTEAGISPRDIYNVKKAFQDNKIVSQPLINVATILMMTGGDYVPKFSDIIVDRFIVAMIQEPKTFANIVHISSNEDQSWNIEFNQERFVNLAHRARDQCPKKTQRSVITSDDTKKIVSRLYYYLILCAQIGDDRMALWQGNPLYYGYGLRSNDKENISRSEIFGKLHFGTTDEEDLKEMETNVEVKIEKGKARKPRQPKKPKNEAKELESQL